MPYHQSSAVGVATLVTATTVLLLGYRLGRTHAAWRDVRAAKRAVHGARRLAWRHTATLAFGGAAILIALMAAGFEMSR